MRRPVRVAACLLASALAAWLVACAPVAPPPAPAVASPAIAAAPAPAHATPFPDTASRVAAPVATPPAEPAEPAGRGATQSQSTPPRTKPVAAVATPSTPPPQASTGAGQLDDRCQTDADCAVKDVGSCCGYNPRCLNHAAAPDPAAARARCAAEGRVGTCGFREVAGCQCTQGHCAPVAAPAVEIVR